jgi:arylsulfatase A-like enzyme
LNPAPAQWSRPNLVFILADQWRAQALPCAGDPDLVAPSLSRLAREGMHCRRAYATNPACSPSRASIITGRWPHACRVGRNDVLLPLDQPSIAAQLKQSGYATAYIGKWHLDGGEQPGFVPPGPRRRGFEYWAAFNRGHRYFNSTYFRDSTEPVRRDTFEPDYQTDLAVDFIRINRTRPFYLYLSWGPPHPPRTPLPSQTERYDPRQFHPAPNVPEHHVQQARDAMAKYYAFCSALDGNLGRLLESIDQAGVYGNTIVVFTSDHGDMLGSQGLEDSGQAFEESASIPLLIRFPGRLPAGRSTDLLISNADIMPTLLGWCGAAVPRAVQGRDLTGILTNQQDARSESVYVQGQIGQPSEWRMVVRGLDKFIVNVAMEVTGLYNLGQDPYEQRNLAGSGAHALVRDELRAHLLDWKKKLRDGLDPSGLRIRQR